MSTRLLPVTDPVTGATFQPVRAGAFMNAVLIEWQRIDGVDRGDWRRRKAINVPLEIYCRLEGAARERVEAWVRRERETAE